jgi:hypothetical protein
MRQQARPGRPLNVSAEHATQWLEDHFSTLPARVLRWIAQHPSLVAFLVTRQGEVADGCLSVQRLQDLARAWSSSLPLRRGATIYRFQDFTQLELDLGLPKGRRRRGSRGSRARGRRRLRSHGPL